MTRRLFAVAMLALAAPLSAAPKKHERAVQFFKRR
jgi:hypothetical protein